MVPLWFGMAIQPHYVWTLWKTCGACLFWNGFSNGGYPAFVELHAASGRADILHLIARAVGLDVIVTGPTGVGTSDDDLEHRVLERLVAEEALLLLDLSTH